MTPSDEHAVGSPSGVELILIGLLLALLGSASIMLMVVGISLLYVGRYAPGAALLAGFLFAGGVFIACYGRYLNRLERRTADPATPAPTPSPRAPEASLPAEPAPAGRVIAVATAAYAVLIAAAGLIWTRGLHVTYNLLAAAALLLCAAIVWRAGKWRARS